MRSWPAAVPSQKGPETSSISGSRASVVTPAPRLSAAQEEGAGGNALAAGDQAGLRPLDLGGGRAPHLAHTFGDEVEAVHVRLRHAPARRVHGEAAVGPFDVPILGEGGPLAPAAESVALQGERDEGAEGVVDLGHLDVPRSEVGAPPQGPAAGPARAHERVLAVVVDHGLVLAV